MTAGLIWEKFRSQIAKTFVFFLFGIVIIVILFQFTDFGKVISLIIGSPKKANLSLFAFLFFYFLFKFSLEWFLISRLGIKVTLRRILLLFSMAELTRELPTIPILMGLAATTKKGGEFFPPKLFSALVFQIPLEFIACFLILSIFGFGDLPFLKLSAIILALLIFVFLFLLRFFPIPSFLKNGSFGKRIAGNLEEFKEGFKTILTFKNLPTAFIFVFLYFFSLGTVLFFSAQACGFSELKLSQAWSVFAINYIVSVIVPLPGDWGLSESSGFFLFSFLGVQKEIALASILTFRIIFSGITWILSLSILCLLWGEIREFLGNKIGR